MSQRTLESGPQRLSLSILLRYVIQRQLHDLICAKNNSRAHGDRCLLSRFHLPGAHSASVAALMPPRRAKLADRSISLSGDDAPVLEMPPQEPMPTWSYFLLAIVADSPCVLAGVKRPPTAEYGAVVPAQAHGSEIPLKSRKHAARRKARPPSDGGRAPTPRQAPHNH